jgi:hypothetical protein
MCGTWIGQEFALVDEAHALACVAQETRVQPCPACLKIIETGAAESEVEHVTDEEFETAHEQIMTHYAEVFQALADA